jgi:hypothetical protein
MMAALKDGLHPRNKLAGHDGAKQGGGGTLIESQGGDIPS